MAKIILTPASKIISRIRSNREKKIYLTYETWLNMKKNSDKIPEEYFFLISGGYVINDKQCLRLECVNRYGDVQEEGFYSFPDKGEEILL